MCVPLGLLLATALVGRPVPEIELPDVNGTFVRLTPSDGRPAVIVFLGVDCPLANLYIPRLKELAGRYPAATVRFFAVDPNDYDAAPEIAAFARRHELPFPFLKDPDCRAADLVGVTRTPEAVVLDGARRVRYRGRIDDQYAVGGKNRKEPTRHDLAAALEEVLAGRPVTVPVTPPAGCLIDRPRPPAAVPAVTYSRDIAPVLAAHCQACHRPGEVGPFPLTSYAEARSHAPMIAEVVEASTMPPWHASPLFGRFRNDRRLSDAQKKLIADWVRLGCPEGEPAGPTTASPASVGWAIGTPDAVFPIPAAFPVPAEGVVEYQHFIVDPGFTSDVWVSAAEVRPGNRRVVHHCNVFLHPPTAVGREELYETGALGSVNLVAFTPGTDPVRLPAGMAKRIPAGWRLHFILHYAPTGTPAEDRTELGLRFLDPAEVRQEVGTKLVDDAALEIPPHTPAHRVERTWTADRDYVLLSMFPHMHLRGKSFRYTAEYPDGTAEVLLDVPVYDFNWQHRYELTGPKRLPAGTVVRCLAVYDNSAGNPANPDPGATVRTGLQSWDEMFNGYFDIALADQDLPAERAAAERGRVRSVAVLAGASVLTGVWMVRLRRRRSTERSQDLTSRTVLT
jgi:peroxiredoxin